MCPFYTYLEEPTHVSVVGLFIPRTITSKLYLKQAAVRLADLYPKWGTQTQSKRLGVSSAISNETKVKNNDFLFTHLVRDSIVYHQPK